MEDHCMCVTILFGYGKCGVAQLPLVFDVFFDGFLTGISD